MELQSPLPSLFPIIDATAEEYPGLRKDHTRALQVSSGNIQPSALDSLTQECFKTENPSELDQIRPRRNNKRTAATARYEHRKKRRVATGKVEGAGHISGVPRFRLYRDKVKQKKEEDYDTVWPPELEQAFLEGSSRSTPEVNGLS